MGTSSLDRQHFFIGGEWVKPVSDRTFTLIDASTEETLATVPEGQNGDIDRAVAAARAGFESSAWRDMTASDRAALLRRFDAALQKRKDDLALSVSRQNGMPLWLSSAFEAGIALSMVNFYADLIDTPQAEDRRGSQLGRETLVSKVPIGVIAAIVPWNYPIALAVSKIAPALAAGCTIVIKPSPGTVLDSYLMAEAAIEAGLPPGVINWVAADRDVGAYLVSHPGVDKVAFTGSTAAGRIIARECGQLLRPVTLELGGKSAAVVLEDVDLAVLQERLPLASLLNNGQTCFNSTRILAPQSRYAEVVDAIASTVSGLAVGAAADMNTQLGPMASAAHRQRVEGYIETGRKEGRLVVGGSRPGAQGRGWFVEPTVFADVNNEATIAREEIFGPVLAVIPYRDEAEAIRLANDSEFGLGGTVWGKDEAHACEVADHIITGTVGINGYAPAIGSPFGGVKASGIGRELGPEALSGYYHWKSTYLM
ncbi:aldehyde dehydrogenase [Flagellatimonas centrodinii]|uniref:aldehyde dehydrogenase n=1 Tax=Flagellatimonas centrodinii TaxID=2806210 RepID=UPI001FEF291F|nr:aldehyde dehydrogenase [Flagellatimonas centrodinii]ULQ47628.1 aldehyde dehydrogenase [Flagellatimonas centrodinii]